MLSAVLSNVDRVSVSDDDRGSGRICGNCLHFQGGLCLTRAAADWGDSSFVSAKRKACSFAAIIPF
jgi:hypothetical protein